MRNRRVLIGTIIAVLLMVCLVPVQAGNPVPDSACHEECEKVYEQEAGVCGRISAEAESQRCGTDANQRYTKCCDECDQVLTKCKEKCYDDYNDKVKMCNKVPDKVKRAKCQQVAAEQLGDCLQKCRRKKRSGD